MTILDYPSDRQSPGKKNVFIDLIFVGLLVVLTIIRDVTSNMAIDDMILITGTIPMIWYLFGYWWTNKPKIRSARNISLTVMYGITLSILSATLVFHVLFLNGANELTFIALFSVVTVTAIDLIISAFSRTRTINTQTFLRLFIYSILVIGISVIPENTRVHFTYRKYPAFLEMYEAKRSTVPFVYIVDEYEKTHGF